ncbi:MAG: ImmA/IrrE family metallo-endopeptidase [Solirubrobacterales bacterium]
MPPSPEIAAKELLQTVWAPEWGYPVDPAKIAERLGLKVYAAGLQDNVSGMLVKHPARDPEIYLNGSDSKNRQRFSCAHELGHYIKRTSEETETTDEGWEYIDLRSPLSATGEDADEVWANRFAAALLMPGDLVKEVHGDVGEPAALAFEFGVSSDAMNFRLQNLGLK